MSKLSHEEKNRIIKRDLPGYKLVEQVSHEATEDRPGYDSIKAKPDVGTPISASYGVSISEPLRSQHLKAMPG